ncbi:helix-turn-helix domain-containing protein [Streptomyces eurythermus]|uniref:helix-turn-helix domain-containing protein n=1 Tax=Streptomyces eurythermus TaxID=42237 RepID=UPI0037012B90
MRPESHTEACRPYDQSRIPGISLVRPPTWPAHATTGRGTTSAPPRPRAVPRPARPRGRAADIATTRPYDPGGILKTGVLCEAGESLLAAQLFRQQGETVAASIRRRRLERCRADLTDPRVRQRPISAAAARWGFLRPADFSRAFRAAYGVTPGELRQTALRGLPMRNGPR